MREILFKAKKIGGLMRKAFSVVITIIFVAITLIGCSPAQTAYQDSYQSFHVGEQQDGLHEAVFSYKNNTEHLILCEESECTYSETGNHFDAGNGKCMCGYNLLVQKGQ